MAPAGGVLSCRRCSSRRAARRGGRGERTRPSRRRAATASRSGPRPARGGCRTQAELEGEALDAYSRTVAGVVERLAGSVASLRVVRASRRGRVPVGAGSAVVLTPDGFLLTSAHVVAGRGREGRATFVDGREFAFRVVGADPLSDLAVLRAEAERPAGGRARRRGAAARRPAGRRDRQPAGLRRVGHGRRDLGARALAARPRRQRGADDRQRDPDRRRAEPRQLRRRAGRLVRARRRGQHRRRGRRARARRADQRRHPPADRRR